MQNYMNNNICEKSFVSTVLFIFSAVEFKEKTHDFFHVFKYWRELAHLRDVTESREMNYAIKLLALCELLIEFYKHLKYQYNTCIMLIKICENLGGYLILSDVIFYICFNISLSLSHHSSGTS